MSKNGMFNTNPSPAKRKPIPSVVKVGLVRSIQSIQSAAKESLRQRGIKNPTKQQIINEASRITRK